jgi:DNA-binding NtrC family response regulator
MKIVLLEDDRLVARALTRVLRTMGHEVLAAQRVAEAQAYVRANPDVRLVISDLGLKDNESGIEFLRWVELERSDVGRVLLTGLSQPVGYPNDPPRQAFLHKPFNTDRLKLLIDEMTTQ